MAGMEVIGHQAVGSGGATSVSFTSIPATYKHLYVMSSARSARSTARYNGSSLTLNDDTGSNYCYSALFGSGNAPTGTEDLGRPNFNYAFDGTAAGATANMFSAGNLWILDYAATDKFTGMIGGSSVVNDYLDTGDYLETLVSGHWRSTAAVNKITITDGTTDGFVQYSEFTLYGLNGA